MNFSVVGRPGSGYSFRQKAEWAEKKALSAFERGDAREGEKFSEIASAYRAQHIRGRR